MEENYVFLNDIEFTKEQVVRFVSSKTVIYSMNFKVHRHLENLSINHKIAEDVLDENDLNLIFDKTVSMYGWYKHSDVFQKMQFEGVNILGMMDDTEFHTFMIMKLYEIRILQKILNGKSPKKIIASKQFIKLIQKIIPGKTEFIEIGKPMDEIMVYDNIEIKFNLGKIPISFKISRNFYKKLKSIIENIICGTNNLWVDLSKQKKSVLLLEFNPSLYSDLISHISKSDTQVILFNNRRSSIWNRDSISILKKTNSKVLSLERILNKQELQFLNHQKTRYLDILDELLHAEDISEKFFIDNFTFWDEIKFELLGTYKKRLSWYLELIFASKIFLKNSKINSVLSLNVVGETEKAIINQMDKTTTSVMLEQAFANYTKDISRYDILSNYSLFPDKIAVWGNVQKNYLSEIHRVSDNKIINCGSPRHDSFFKNSNNLPNGKKNVILLCPRPIVEPAARHHTRMYIKYEKILKQIILDLQKFSDKDIVVKLHPGDISHNHMIKTTINELDSNIVIHHSTSIDELIANSELVLVISPDGYDPSTVILESIIMEKPIINLVLDGKFYDFSYEKNNAVISITENENFMEILTKIFTNSEFKNKIRENGKKFLNEYLNNHGIASESLAGQLVKL